MSNSLKTVVEDTLKKFPEVLWDRWDGDLSDAETGVLVFGWIERHDGHRKRLGFDGHRPCRRVESSFAVINCVKLNGVSLESKIHILRRNGAANRAQNPRR